MTGGLMVPGFKHERKFQLDSLGVAQLLIFDGSMVKTRVILELYLYL